MTYGVTSHQTNEILAAAGLLDAINVDESDDVVIEIDIVFGGALDESFQVQSDYAADIANVLFEAIAEEFPDKEFEVSAYNRTCPDDCWPILGLSQEVGEG